jgi:hypothetical protein
MEESRVRPPTVSVPTLPGPEPGARWPPFWMPVKPSIDPEPPKLRWATETTPEPVPEPLVLLTRRVPASMVVPLS